ncbi:MAG: B12-binding domain-containing radical SAM protein [Candidatus Omnitrophota bacterium]|nr:MAG: B12-binding domain-containing radical SAM protein [Candidatus Omnitrophota bacterium]
MKRDVKINFIIPPNPYLGDDRRNVPLGILYVASMAESAGYDVSITDLRGICAEEWRNAIAEADVYSIVAATPDYPLAVTIAKTVKAMHESSLTVLGGTHATCVPEEIGKEFDKVVIGEGELAFLDILDDFRNNKSNKRFYHRELIKDLDSIPFPARHMLPFNSLFSKNALAVGGESTGTIITSRGCPNSCSFCANTKVWRRKIRFRTPDNVTDEIKQIIYKYGIKSFRFQDDNLLFKKDRMVELCKKMEPLGIKWRGLARLDSLNDLSVLKLMKKAGCLELGFGIESLMQEVLDKNSKAVKLKDIHSAFENMRQAELKSRIFLILGLPGERKGFTKRLNDFLDNENPYAVNIATMVPYPGTDIYNNPEKYNIKLKTKDFSQYLMSVGLMEHEADKPLIFEHDCLTEDEILEERKKAFVLLKSRNKIKNF